MLSLIELVDSGKKQNNSAPESGISLNAVSVILKLKDKEESYVGEVGN